MYFGQSDPTLIYNYDPQYQSDIENRTPQGQTYLKGPILTDPGYGPKLRSLSPSRIVRLRGSDAKKIYKRATASTGAPFLLDTQLSNNRQSNKTKNYLNENVKKLRRTMHDKQFKQEIAQKSASTPVKALWHMKKFNNAQSKDKSQLLSRPQSSQSNFLRAHAKTGPEHLRSRSVDCSRRNSLSSSTNELPIQVDKMNQTNNDVKPNYIKINSNFVKAIPNLRKSTSIEAIEKSHEKQEKALKRYQEKQKGKLPDYVEKIKEKRSSEAYAKMLSLPDPECPPGHTKVDESQRLTTLKQLEFNRTVLEKKLGHLPIRNDSVALRQTKSDIEKKLVELDEAIKIFTKPKVFIKVDE